MAIYGAGMKGRLYAGAEKVKKAYQGNKRVYSSGNICTYHVDAGITYQEEVDEGVSCLSPKTFIPVKEGWEFVGWRQDTVAAGEVLGSLAMGDDPKELYAVFKQEVVLSYIGNGNTGGATASQTGIRYYNNGNMANPNFTVSANGFSRTNYTFQRWRLNGTTGTVYAPGAVITLGTNSTLYAEWAATPFYVIQGGYLVSGNYTNAGKDKYGHSLADSNWGYGGHTNSGGGTPRIYVTFNTKACTRITISGSYSNWGSSYRGIWLSVSAGIANEELPYGDAGRSFSKTYTVPINTSITVALSTSNDSNANMHFGLTFTSIYLS